MWSVRLSLRHGGAEVGPRTGDSGPDGPDRNSDDHRSLLIGESEHLRQHERLATITVDHGEEAVGVIRWMLHHRPALRPETFVEPALSSPRADLIGTDVPRDGDEPGAHGGLRSERAETPEGTKIGLADEILDLPRRPECGADAPHHRLGGPDQQFDRTVIALAGRQGDVEKRILGGHSRSMSSGRQRRARLGRGGEHPVC